MSGSGPFQDKPSLRVEGLSLARGQRVLFRDLSFALASGDYAEVQGANGAGKTSLLRAIAGFLRPHEGCIVVERAEEPALAMHYIAHANAVKGADSVGAHLRYWAGLFGGAKGGDVLKRLGLEGLSERPARTLSQGQARRLALSRLLIAPRPIWLLDEPAAGLDTQGRAVLTELIAAHRADGGIAIAAVHEALGAQPSSTMRLGA